MMKCTSCFASVRVSCKRERKSVWLKELASPSRTEVNERWWMTVPPGPYGGIGGDGGTTGGSGGKGGGGGVDGGGGDGERSFRILVGCSVTATPLTSGTSTSWASLLPGWPIHEESCSAVTEGDAGGGAGGGADGGEYVLERTESGNFD